MRSSSELNDERLFGRPLPALAVDQDLGVRRLDTNCDRAVSLDARGITIAACAGVLGLASGASPAASGVIS